VDQAATVDFQRFAMDRGATFQPHVHDDAHQLAWASSGVLMVGIGDRFWMLPPALALGIPAGIEHTTTAHRKSVLEGVYIQAAGRPAPWDAPTVLAVPPLARGLLGFLANEPGPEPTLARAAETLLLGLVRPVTGTASVLPLPRDPRARAVAGLLIEDPADVRGLEELGRATGASSRTLLRLFLAETGLTFSQWRAQARLQASLPYLAAGQPVSTVARRVGYGTASAFVAAFRRATGRTPGAYFDEP
jgi:AraC-like DNA-binding protein